MVTVTRFMFQEIWGEMGEIKSNCWVGMLWAAFGLGQDVRG